MSKSRVHDLVSAVKQVLADQIESVRQGSTGVKRDAAVHYVDWGLRLAEISTKFHIFHGTADTFVPFAFAEHIARNAPNCELHKLEGYGHLFPFQQQSRIFETARSEIALV